MAQDWFKRMQARSIPPFRTLELLIFAGTWFSLVPLPAADPSLVLDLLDAGTQAGLVTRVFGSTGNGVLGTPVAGGHDCDGDTHRDVALVSLVASPEVDGDERFRAGEIYLIFGDGTIGGSIDTDGVEAGVLKIAGDQGGVSGCPVAGSVAGEVAGAEIWMDDVTGDGLGDLLIGRQNFTPGAGRAGAGALSIIVGSAALRQHAATLTYLDLRNPPQDIMMTTFLGVSAYDRFGIWMRTGDVTGDGIPDIVVGSDEVDLTRIVRRLERVALIGREVDLDGGRGPRVDDDEKGQE